MSWASLSSHLNGVKHRRRLANSGIDVVSEVSSAAHPSSANAHGGASASFQHEKERSSPLRIPAPPAAPPVLERWQEMGPEGVKCIPCDKYCDGYHELTPDHIRKLAIYIEAYEDKYREPAEP